MSRPACQSRLYELLAIFNILLSCIFRTVDIVIAVARTVEGEQKQANRQAKRHDAAQDIGDPAMPLEPVSIAFPEQRNAPEHQPQEHETGYNPEDQLA